jgi:hypothetical protein
MRRTTAILTICFCAVTGCRGGEAQESYDGAVAAAQRAVDRAPIPARRAPAVDAIALGRDVPWTIALLSDAKAAPPVKRTHRVIDVDTEPERDLRDLSSEDADVYLAVDPGPVDETPAAPRTCNGVVKTRS